MSESTESSLLQTFLFFSGLFLGFLFVSNWYCGVSHGDDTFIYLRYVQNALEGHGYVFNEGEASFGVTSPLWAFLMTPIAGIFGNTISVWKFFSSAFFAFGAASCGRTFSRYIGFGWAAFLSFVVALAPHTLRWSGTGMENGLVVLIMSLVLAGWDRLSLKDDRRKPTIAVWVGGLLGILPFVRPELGGFAIALGLLTLTMLSWRKRQLDSILLVAGGVIVSGVLTAVVWNNFGSIFPQAAAAKGLSLAKSEPLYGLKRALKIVISGAGPTLLFLAIVTRKKEVDVRYVWLGAALISVALSIGYLGIVNHLVSTRYSVYLSFPIVLSACYVASERRMLKHASVRFFFALQLVISSAILVYLLPVTGVSEAESYSRAAEEFKSRVDAKEPRVAIKEVGAFGFYSGAYIIDLVGLTDRATLRWVRRHSTQLNNPKQLERLLLERKATHYLEYDPECEPPQFPSIKTTLIMEADLERNNYSGGSIRRPHLCAYTLID